MVSGGWDARTLRRLQLVMAQVVRRWSNVLVRRMTVCVYRRRFFLLFCGLLAAALSVLCGLFAYGFVCSNIQVWKHVHQLCQQYKDSEVVGNLCHPLCEGRVNSLSCQPLHSGKELVFSAVLDGVPLVFKSSRRNLEARTEVYAVESGTGRHLYPSEEEFIGMVASLVQNELNVSATEEQLGKLVHLAPVASEPEFRFREMRDLWRLLQDHEYLAVRIFIEQEILPGLVGSCGDVFAVDFAEPLAGGGLWEHEDEEWAERLRRAVLILELVERMESVAPAPLRLCDVRLGHLGLDGAKASILDGDSLVTQAVADALAGDGASCKRHEDCHYLDCYAACVHGACAPPSTNNNLQAVCEKVFLGARLGGSLLLPGLLASPHSPPSLSTLLRLCAHPHGEEGLKYGTPDDVRDRLVATVEEMVYEIDLNA